VTRRKDRAALVDVAAVVGVLVLLGVLGGVLWWLLVEPARFEKTADGVTMSEVELAKRFAVDGWYSVVALVLGVPAGLGLTWWRSGDFRRTVVLLAVGSAGAAAAMALTGRLLGPPAAEAVLDRARVGARVPVELAVSADPVWASPVYLLWPIGVLVGALVMLWSSTRDPGARRHAGDSDEIDAHESASDGRNAPQSAL